MEIPLPNPMQHLIMPIGTHYGFVAIPLFYDIIIQFQDPHLDHQTNIYIYIYIYIYI